MGSPEPGTRRPKLRRRAALAACLAAAALTGCGRAAATGRTAVVAAGFQTAGKLRWHSARFQLTRAAYDEEQAIARAPNVSAPYERLAAVMAALGHPGTALALAQRALTLVPSSATYINDVGLLAMADGQWNLAADAYGHAIATHPADWLALDGLALVAVHRRDWVQAEDDVNRAQALGGPEGETYDTYGRMLLSEGQAGAALAFFEDACRLSPGWWQPRYDEARAEEALGHRQAALSDARKALAVDPAAGPALALLVRLGSG
jgi:Flp pilus assembly protein TadD